MIQRVKDATRPLDTFDESDQKAAVDWVPLFYDELRRMAAAHMARESPSQTLQPTALVHEVWLRLGADAQPVWRNRAHFFGAAATAMRRILVERARQRLAVKRGEGVKPLNVYEFEIPSPTADDDKLLCVNDAVEKLEKADSEMAKLVELRYFARMPFKETAQAMGIAVSTAKKRWKYARTWLQVELKKSRKSR